MDLSGVNWLMHRRQVARSSPFIRIVNYHDVPPCDAANFERHLQFYKRRFVSAERRDLEELLAGRWRHDRPGFMITFDDGLKSHFEVAAPLLEKHGFTGWFFTPTEFLDTPRENQRQYASTHQIGWSKQPGSDLGSMTWDDARSLDRRGHIIGCHTTTHVRLSAKLTAEDLDREIPQAKHRLEAELGHEVDVFCWVGGEEWSYSATAAKVIRESGFRLSFMNSYDIARPNINPLQLHRNCISSSDPLWYVRYVLSGFRDKVFKASRKRVNALTAEPQAKPLMDAARNTDENANKH
jgi:peptidoglycan/xylan/chitin deacetylase (PgdA/CDA1 family)